MGPEVSGGTADGRLVEIDTSTGAILRESQVSNGPVVGGLGDVGGLAVAPNSSEVLAADTEGGVRVVASDGIVSPLVGGSRPHDREPRTSARWPSRPATGVHLVDFNSRRVLGTIEGPPATLLAFSGDGTRLAIESGVGNIAVVDVATRRTTGPEVTLPFPATIAVERERVPARRRKLRQWRRPHHRRRHRPDARHAAR